MYALNTKFFPESSNAGAVKANIPHPFQKKSIANNQNKTIVKKTLHLIPEKGGSKENKTNSRASVFS